MFIENAENHAALLLQDQQKKWDETTEVYMSRAAYACHWQQSAEEYDQIVREYYIEREKHQTECCRLNQVLYGPFTACPALEQPAAMIVCPASCRAPLLERSQVPPSTHAPNLKKRSLDALKTWDQQNKRCR